MVITDPQRCVCKLGEIERQLEAAGTTQRPMDNWGVRCDDGVRFQVPGYLLRPSPGTIDLPVNVRIFVTLGPGRNSFRLGTIRKKLPDNYYGVLCDAGNKIKAAPAGVFLALDTDREQGARGGGL